jgi:hypothetical protein
LLELPPHDSVKAAGFHLAAVAALYDVRPSDGCPWCLRTTQNPGKERSQEA